MANVCVHFFFPIVNGAIDVGNQSSNVKMNDKIKCAMYVRLMHSIVGTLMARFFSIAYLPFELSMRCEMCVMFFAEALEAKSSNLILFPIF